MTGLGKNLGGMDDNTDSQIRTSITDKGIIPPKPMDSYKVTRTVFVLAESDIDSIIAASRETDEVQWTTTKL